MVREVKDLDDFRQILKGAGDKLVAVDFTATWCGPCKMMGPVFESESQNPANKNVIFLKVDVDDCEDVSLNLKISCMPTFHFYKNGELVSEFSGANKDKLLECLSKYRT
ncbi:thioredoxin [Nerophis ophidion]|uniref:thioredoxin n=1 Tax=Nerophis ophidion TaxID=159077 RepID=UPI002AE07B5E|nr:thioredoxin [Nerophis ophidion]